MGKRTDTSQTLSSEPAASSHCVSPQEVRTWHRNILIQASITILPAVACQRQGRKQSSSLEPSFVLLADARNRVMTPRQICPLAHWLLARAVQQAWGR